MYVDTLSIWGYFGNIYYVPTGCTLNYLTPPAFLFLTPSLIWPLVAFGLGLDRNFWGTPAHKLPSCLNASADCPWMPPRLCGLPMATQRLSAAIPAPSHCSHP